MDMLSMKIYNFTLIKMDCLISKVLVITKYPLFGYELNKLNNYLMPQNLLL